MGAIFNDELRRELEALAREGHVMARYLYAMWKPDEVLEEQALEQFLQWQMNALEFSYANAAQGEPAGFIAFAESYLQPLFTPQNTRLARLLLNAAHQCGYGSLEIMKLLDRFVSEDGWNIQLETEVGVTRQRFDELTAQLTAGCR